MPRIAEKTQTAESEMKGCPKLECNLLYSLDKVSDVFGDLYRVWIEETLIGTFYQRIIDGKWVSQPTNSCERHHWDSDIEAIEAIVSNC